MLAWSHIYLGRMLDLECKRDQALAEYNEALAVRDGQLDTRLAAERGVKAAYVQRGHEHDCDDDSADDAPGTSPEQPSLGGQPAQGKPTAQEPRGLNHQRKTAHRSRSNFRLALSVKSRS